MRPAIRLAAQMLIKKLAEEDPCLGIRIVRQLAESDLAKPFIEARRLIREGVDTHADTAKGFCFTFDFFDECAPKALPTEPLGHAEQLYMKPISVHLPNQTADQPAVIVQTKS